MRPDELKFVHAWRHLLWNQWIRRRTIFHRPTGRETGENNHKDLTLDAKQQLFASLELFRPGPALVLLM